MKIWFLGGSGSRGAARGPKSGVGARLDRFVTEIAQAVQDQVPVNYAVDANYQPIANAVTTSARSQSPLSRARGTRSRRG